MSPVAWVAALGFSIIAQVPPAQRPRPERIVSLNLCTDQLLLQLVEPKRIAAITNLATDPEQSVQADRARAVPVGRATAEEVILLRPDLALAGEYGAREAVEVLRRWGIPIVQFAPAESWEAIREQLRRAAIAVGEVERAESLVERMEASLKALEFREPAPTLRAIVIQHDGGTFGSGTLPDAVLRAAGFRNVASELGIIGYGSIALEQLLVSNPDLVVILNYHGEVATLGRIYLRHSALRGHSLGRIELPAAAFMCGTTETVKVAQHLVAWRERALAGAPK
jgi:iron complex transport system substrate-binding protein